MKKLWVELSASTGEEPRTAVYLATEVEAALASLAELKAHSVHNYLAALVEEIAKLRAQVEALSRCREEWKKVADREDDPGSCYDVDAAEGTDRVARELGALDEER